MRLLFDLNPLLKVLRRVIHVVAVLTWVRHLVFEHLDEFVEEDGDQGADYWSNPIYPMLVVECGGHDAGAKATCGIE